MHRPDVLLDELRRGFGIVLPLNLVRRMRFFAWTTDLRYNWGRLDMGETVASLKTIKAIFTWVEEQLP